MLRPAGDAQGLLDRLVLPGVAFDLGDPAQVRPMLTNIRKLAGIVTYGRPRLAAWHMGDPPRKLVTRYLRWFVAPGAPVAYHALYDVNVATEASDRDVPGPGRAAHGPLLMRMLVVYAHPVSRQLQRRGACRGWSRRLRRAGHEVRELDLYGIGFDPVHERGGAARLHDPRRQRGRIAEHLEHLRWAEGLIFVYPTWWYSLPAMLKGWLDRVFVPYETFELGKGLNPILGRLTNIRLIGGITTYGSPRWWIRLVVRDPGKTIVMKGLKPLCAKGCRTFWLGLYRMDTVSEARRQAFLDRVEALAARL